MAVLQIGVPRSGNSWLHRILVLLHDLAGVPARSFIACHPIHEEARGWPLSLAGQADIDMVDIEPHALYCGISTVFREEIADAGRYVDSCRIVWSHSPYVERMNDFYRRFSAVVYVLRDPRDVAVSLAQFRFTPYSRRFHSPTSATSPQEYLDQHLSDLTWYWVRHVGRYLAVAHRLDIRFVFYERLLRDLGPEVAQLARDLGLAIPPDRLDAALHELTFEAMRLDSPQHLRHGRASLWREALSEEQLAGMDELAGPMLRLLGYQLASPGPDDAAPGGLPSEARRVSPSALRDAYALCSRVAARRCQLGWEL
jgi:aryl sulfotransferase